MEDEYDRESAKYLLSKYIEEYFQGQEDDVPNHLSLFNSERYQIQASGNPTIYRLANVSEDASDIEEATFTLHGIILEKDFPPIVPPRHEGRNQRQNKNRVAVLRQYVALTGLDMDYFNNSLESFAKIHRHFEDTLSADRLESHELVSMDDSAAFVCHTRYFTSRRSSDFAVQIPFGLGVDPNGDLENLKGDTHIHILDNMVQYLGRKEADDGSVLSYQNINPVKFQIGDIVEVSVSIFCVPTRTEKYKMRASLKSIILLNNVVREKARDEKFKNLLSTKPITTTLKRHIVSTDDDITLSKKYARMELS